MWGTVKTYIAAIPYIAIVILLVALAIVRYQLQASEADKLALATENSVLKDTNAEQEKTIKTIIATRTEEHKILLDLSDKVDDINNSVDETKSSVDDLKAVNTDVKDYLSRMVPPDLNRLLNK